MPKIISMSSNEIGKSQTKFVQFFATEVQQEIREKQSTVPPSIA